MPTAEPFKALGAGNGFTYCSTKVDVSGSDYWTTLSGVNKNSPGTSDLLIAESLQLAMKLWWNLHSVSVNANHSGNSAGVPPKSISGITIGDPVAPFEPIDRACTSFINSYKQADDPFGSSVFATVLLRHQRLYNGDTSDESNFVGYGAPRLISLNAQIAFIGTQASSATTAGVAIGGHISNAETDFSGFIQEFDYVELDGMHFVSMAFAKSRDSGNPTGTVDASAISASSEITVSSTLYTADAKITSLDFYTYE